MQHKQSQTLLTSVIPAKAGIHHLAIPPSTTPLDAGFHRHDVLILQSVGKNLVLEFAFEESLTQ